MSKRVRGSVKNKVVATELAEERKNLNFDPEEIYSFYNFDPEAKKEAEYHLNNMRKHPEMANSHKWYEMTRAEKMENWMQRLNCASKIDHDFYFKKRPKGTFYWPLMNLGQSPIGLHQIMFTTAIEALSTPEQKANWLPKALNLDIHGSYGQTEIGHGSNVAALETTAVLDKSTDEFVLNTPTMTSTKWWPGEMGHFANYSLVFARLIIESDGVKNDYGVAPFLV